MYSADVKDLDMERLKKQAIMPKPKGYKLLIAMPSLEEKTDGGVFLPDSMKQQESTASVVGLVLMMGNEAYKDEDKFPSGPWCKEGDWVVFRSYSGTRFKVENQEFRIINDDTVEAVVEDPRELKSMSELSKIEDETEFEPVDQGEETQKQPQMTVLKLKLLMTGRLKTVSLEQTPQGQLTKTRARPHSTVSVFKKLNNLNMNITKSAEPKKS